MQEALVKSNRELLFRSVFAVVILFAVVLRWYDLAARPLHNDEGVNHYFLQETARLGYYPYSHENYHGPLYFYLTFAIFNLTEDSERGLRASAGIVGVLTILLLLALRKSEGDGFVLLSAFVVAVSSSLLYYSRYAIHETLFIFSALLFAVSFLRCVKSREPRWIYGLGVALALLISTKETFSISLFCLFFSMLGYFVAHDLGTRRWPKPQVLIRDYGAHVCAALMLAVFLVFVTFTGGFRWGDGLYEMVIAVKQWIGRNTSDTGHFKPFFYYFWVMLQTEPHLIVPLLFPFVAILFSPRRCWTFFLSDGAAFYRFVTVWYVFSFAVYSYVRYKTPWLVINLTLPGSLALVRLTQHLWRGELDHLKFPVALSAAVLTIGVAPYWEEVKRALVPQDPERFIHELRKAASIVTIGLASTAFLSWLVLYCWERKFAHYVFIAGAAISVCALYPFFQGEISEDFKMFLGLCGNVMLISGLFFLFLRWMGGGRASKVLACGWCMAIVGSLCYRGALYCYTHSFGDGNPFSYVHTAAGMVEMVNDIHEYRVKHPNARILIAVNGYWPLPFYLRKEAASLGYLTTNDPEQYANEYDILILEKEIKWSPPTNKWSKHYYRLSDVEETYTFFKRH